MYVGLLMFCVEMTILKIVAMTLLRQKHIRIFVILVQNVAYFNMIKINMI